MKIRPKGVGEISLGSIEEEDSKEEENDYDDEYWYDQKEEMAVSNSKSRLALDQQQETHIGSEFAAKVFSRIAGG